MTSLAIELIARAEDKLHTCQHARINCIRIEVALQIFWHESKKCSDDGELEGGRAGHAHEDRIT